MAEPAGRDWTSSGAFEDADGVHRIPLPLPTDGLRAVNVYALTGDDGIVLVDSGWAIREARTQLAEALARSGTTSPMSGNSSSPTAITTRRR